MKHGPLIHRKRGICPGEFAKLHRMFLAWRHMRDGVELQMLDPAAFRAALAPVAHKAVVEDRQQPAPQIALGAKPVERVIGLDQRFVHQIVSPIVAHQRARIASQRRQLLDRPLSEPLQHTHDEYTGERPRYSMMLKLFSPEAYLMATSQARKVKMA